MAAPAVFSELGWVALPPLLATQPLQLATALLAVALAYLLITYRSRALGSAPVVNGVPVMPGALPLVGNLVPLVRNLHRVNDHWHEVTRHFGGRPWCWSAPGMPLHVVISDPRDLEHVLSKAFANYVKGPYFASRSGCLLGAGIFAVDGEEWRMQRKVAARLFSVAAFRRYLHSVFREEMGRLMDGHLSPAAAAGTPVDLQDLFFRFTLDSFARVGFGTDLHCLAPAAGSPGAPLTRIPFAAAFDRAQAIVVKRFLLPFWQLAEALGGDGATLAADLATIRGFSAKVLAARRGAAADDDAAAGRVEDGSSGDGAGGDDAGSGGGEDLLSHFLRLRDEAGRPLDDQRIADYILNMIIAGRDTTAQALSWAFAELGAHPEAQAALAAEAAAATQGGASLDLSYEALRGLRYAHAVLWETLRLHPSVPKQLKTCVADDVLPSGVFMPAGATVVYSSYICGRSPDIWGADAEQWQPSRWLGSSPQPSPYAYPVFNAGPRTCLGKSFAEIEAVYCLCCIASRYCVHLLPGQSLHYAPSLTLPMVNGLRVVLQPRNQQQQQATAT